MTTFVSKGTHFVGERGQAAPQGPSPQFASSREPRDIVHYDDDELEWASDELDRSEAHKTEQWSEFKKYIKHYAGQRRLELDSHRLRPCWNRCDGCGNCTCGKTMPGEWARCLCADGKKTLSPYRIVWINNSKKSHWQNFIWQVGVGYVPRAYQIDRTKGDARGIDRLDIPGSSR